MSECHMAYLNHSDSTLTIRIKIQALCKMFNFDTTPCL